VRICPFIECGNGNEGGIERGECGTGGKMRKIEDVLKDCGKEWDRI